MMLDKTAIGNVWESQGMDTYVNSGFLGFILFEIGILGFQDSLFQDPSFVAFDNRSVDRGVGEPRLLTPTNELATQNDRLIEKMCATESILSR